jgi:hypothetical protein
MQATLSIPSYGLTYMAFHAQFCDNGAPSRLPSLRCAQAILQATWTHEKSPMSAENPK